MGVTVQASASASVSDDPQLSDTVSWPVPLTTVFTPPPECKTPFAFDPNCYDQFECDGSYMPFLYIPNSGSPGGTSTIQCYPVVTTFGNGFVDAIYAYSPGLFCPDGMTTATSSLDAFICCSSGLTYNGGDWCSATITTGAAFIGSSQQNSALVLSTTNLSSANSMTLYASAIPVYLTAIRSSTFGNVPSQSTPPVSGDSSATTPEELPTTATSTTATASSEISSSNSSGCRAGNCQSTTSTQLSTGGESTPATSNPPNSDGSKSSDRTGVKIGIGVGVSVGGVIALALLVLGFMLLRRYRRLLKQHQLLISPRAGPDGSGSGSEGGGQEVQHIYQEKLPPELPVPESRAELEGTQVDNHGSGIYVWKPELEGTAGISGVKGIFVKAKSELETKYKVAAHSTLNPGVVTYPESPITGALFTSQRYPRPTAGVVQT